MFPQGRKQITALLILLGLLMMNVPAATAGGGGALPNQTVGVAYEDGETFFSRAWSWMRPLWAGAAPIQPEAGPCIDPDGRCTPGAAPIHLDQGLCIEPNGGCVASSSSG